MLTTVKVVSAFAPADATIECIKDPLDCDFLRPGTTSRFLRPV